MPDLTDQRYEKQIQQTQQTHPLTDSRYEPPKKTTSGGGVGQMASDLWGGVQSAVTTPGAIETLNRGIGLGFVDPAAVISAAGDWSAQQLGMQTSLPGDSFVDKYNAATDQNDALRAAYAQKNPWAAPFVQGTGGVAGGFGAGGAIEDMTAMATPYVKAVARYIPAVATGAHEGWMNTPEDAPIGQKLANAIAGAATGVVTQGVSDIGVGTVARVANPAARPVVTPTPPIVKPIVKGVAKAGAGLAAADLLGKVGLGEFGKEYGIVRGLEAGAHNVLEGLGNIGTRIGNWWERTAPTGPPIRVNGRFARGQPTYHPTSTALGTGATQQLATSPYNPIAANSPLANTLGYWMSATSD